MAHDFSITYENEKKGEEANRTAWFSGFCNGILYEVFEMQHHYAGVSGDGQEEETTLEDARRSLDLAIDYFDNWSNYPDPTRMDEIKEFRKFLDTVNEGKCVLFFG